MAGSDLHRAVGTVISAGISAGAASVPSGLNLTDAAGDAVGTLTSSGGTHGAGQLTLDLSTTGLVQNASGTVCFQTQVL